MPAGLDAVHPHGGVVVHRLEVQQHPLPRPALRHPDGAAVPHGGVEVRVADTGQLGLGAERHDDLAGQVPVDQPAFEP